MTQYLISFDDGAMTFPEGELPDVAKAAREVVHEAKDAGVWVFSGARPGRLIEGDPGIGHGVKPGPRASPDDEDRFGTRSRRP
jgi:hypothetical protein